MEAGTISSMGPQQPATCTRTPPAAQSFAACGRDSGWAGPRLSSDKVKEVLVSVCSVQGGGRSGYRGWTGKTSRTSTCTCTRLPCLPLATTRLVV